MNNIKQMNLTACKVGDRADKKIIIVLPLCPWATEFRITTTTTKHQGY
jgi:hypothetical protein